MSLKGRKDALRLGAKLDPIIMPETLIKYEFEIESGSTGFIISTGYTST